MVVVVVIAGAIIGIVVWRRRRNAQNGAGGTHRDSAIYTYPTVPSVNITTSRKPQFHGSAL